MLASPSKALPEPLSSELVAVCIVTHDSAADLPACLAAVAAQGHRNLELVVVDCASRDGSAEVARTADAGELPRRVFAWSENRGFAGGMNAAIAATDAPWVLCLNADARPEPEFLARLLAGAAAHPGLRVGAVTGRLVRPPTPGAPRRLDACGMRLTATWRHLDRGSGQVDRGQLARPEQVFGGTGAATLFRRAALADVAIGGEIFAEEFHSFREDAELAFRLHERGWAVLYQPDAVCEHRRSNLPERRGRMSPEVNFHTLKNRYLLRTYHQSAGNAVLTLLPTLGRDLLALGYVLLRERSSLAAYAWLWRRRAWLWQRRRQIQQRRTAARWQVNRWFLRRSLPL